MRLITRYYPLLPVTPSYYMFYREKRFYKTSVRLLKLLLHLKMRLITRYYPLLPVTPSYYMFYSEKDFTRLVSDS